MQTTKQLKHTYEWQNRDFGQHERLVATANQIMEDFGLYNAPTWLAFKRSDEVQGGLWYLTRYHDHHSHLFAGLRMRLVGNELTVETVNELEE